ncbi:hypothetical protein HDU84_002035 [Entophlyctis sp. JEL0112]|nr:hypothetical protein HDU84_002035 [Entophlyctis sp. JEL0112]
MAPVKGKKTGSKKSKVTLADQSSKKETSIEIRDQANHESTQTASVISDTSSNRTAISPDSKSSSCATSPMYYPIPLNATSPTKVHIGYGGVAVQIPRNNALPMARREPYGGCSWFLYVVGALHLVAIVAVVGTWLARPDATNTMPVWSVAVAVGWLLVQGIAICACASARRSRSRARTDGDDFPAHTPPRGSGGLSASIASAGPVAASRSNSYSSNTTTNNFQSSSKTTFSTSGRIPVDFDDDDFYSVHAATAAAVVTDSSRPRSVRSAKSAKSHKLRTTVAAWLGLSSGRQSPDTDFSFDQSEVVPRQSRSMREFDGSFRNMSLGAPPQRQASLPLPPDQRSRLLGQTPSFPKDLGSGTLAPTLSNLPIKDVPRIEPLPPPPHLQTIPHPPSVDPTDYLGLSIHFHENTPHLDIAAYYASLAAAQSNNTVAMFLYAISLRHGLGVKQDSARGLEILCACAHTAMSDYAAISQTVQSPSVLSSPYPSLHSTNSGTMPHYTHPSIHSDGSNTMPHYTPRPPTSPQSTPTLARSEFSASTLSRLPGNGAVRALARKELASALYEIANCYRNGWGVTVSHQAAHYYYTVAAGLGDVESSVALGDWYVKGGSGVKVDRKIAARYYRMAVEGGYKEPGLHWIYKDKYKE